MNCWYKKPPPGGRLWAGKKRRQGGAGAWKNKRKGDTGMAISNLLPRKAVGSRTRGQTLHDRLGYDQKEEKTGGGELVSSYMCC